MKNIHFLFALLVATTLFQSCQKEPLDNSFATEAPALPSIQSFVMPLDGFEEVDSVEHVGPRTITTKDNFAFAGLNVLVWNTVLTVTMAVPVASFAEAFNHQGVFVGNNTFEWKYNFFAEGRVHTATLTGEVLNTDEDVAWTMSISRNNGFQDFVFYTGLTKADGSANWTLNHQPNFPESFLQIDYTKVSNEEFEIKYTNIRPGHQDNGDFIEHRSIPTGDFNRFYNVFGAKDNNSLNIEWNAPSGNGRVKNLGHFGDDAWHCWDEMQDDTNC